jgi:Tol biopolymer transport system component
MKPNQTKPRLYTVLCVLLSSAVSAQIQLTFNTMLPRGWPRWSPDGREIANWHGDVSWLSIIAVDTLQERLILQSAGPYDWSPDGRMIAFVDGPSLGDLRLYWTSPTSGGRNPVLAVSAPMVPRSWPRWTKDSTALLYGRGNQTNVFRVALVDGIEVPVSVGSEVRNEHRADPVGVYASFSITYACCIGNAIARAPLGGGGTDTILVPADGRSKWSPIVWSPDGLSLAYEAETSPGGPSDLYTIGRNGGQETRITASPPGRGFRVPDWSPDGEWLAAWSPPAITVVDVATGTTVDVTPPLSGTFVPDIAVSPDATRIVFTYPDSRGILQLWMAWSGRRPVPSPVGSQRVGSSLGISVFAPNDSGMRYVIGAAFAKDPPIQVGGRAVPLALDSLLIASLTRPDIFASFSGILDSFGRGNGSIALPSSPSLAGTRFYIAFMTLDSVMAVRTVSGARPVTILP